VRVRRSDGFGPFVLLFPRASGITVRAGQPGLARFPSPVQLGADTRFGRYRGRVTGKRPPRSAGTTVLLDVLRRPPRYLKFPPGAEESPADIRAVRAGDARRIGCFARAASGPYPRGYKRGMLEVRGHSATWQRSGSRRGSRLVIDVAGTSVIKARPADHREQRFGSPGNIHLFALVRCATPTGPLDLVVPAADVPLLAWFFGGHPEVPESVLLSSAVTPGRAGKLMTKKLAWGLSATACGFMVVSPVATANVPGLSGWWMGVLYGIGCMLFINGSTSILRARRRKRHEEAA